MSSLRSKFRFTLRAAAFVVFLLCAGLAIIVRESRAVVAEWTAEQEIAREIESHGGSVRYNAYIGYWEYPVSRSWLETSRFRRILEDKYYMRITRVDVHGSDITSDELCELHLERLQHLTALDLWDCNSIDDDAIGCINDMPHLRRVALYNTSMSEEALEKVSSEKGVMLWSGSLINAMLSDAR